MTDANQPTEHDHSTFMQMKEAQIAAEERADRFLLEADTCQLTGMLNRRGLMRRTNNRDWGWYVVADLDGFKTAQDKPGRGHAYGDATLQEFADYILTNTRHRDLRARDLIAARTGGDEFTVWTETRTGARRIKEALREWVSVDTEVTASAGIGQTPEAADAACYMDKKRKN